MSPPSLYMENHVVFICLLSVSPSRSYVFLNQELMNPSTLPDAEEAQTLLDDGWVHKLISWHVVERNLGGYKKKIEYLCICSENSAPVPTCIYPIRIREQIFQWPEWWIWIQIWMKVPWVWGIILCLGKQNRETKFPSIPNAMRARSKTDPLKHDPTLWEGSNSFTHSWSRYFWDPEIQ